MKPFAVALLVLACVLAAPRSAGAVPVQTLTQASVDVQAIAVASGNNQTLTSSAPDVYGTVQTIFAPLSVLVTGTNGKPVQGALIFFGSSAPTAQVGFYRGGSMGQEYETVSDQSGHAAIPPNTLLSFRPGDWTITAYAKTPPFWSHVLTQTFTVHTVPRLVEKLAILSGNNAAAYVTAGKASFGSLSLSDKNAASGAAVSGQPITFVCTAQPPGAACPAGGTATVTTDSSGVATLSGFAPNEVGTYAITATAATGATVTFSLTVPKLVEKLTILSGNNSYATLSAGKALFGRLSVSDKNAVDGSAVAGQTIKFVCTSQPTGGPCIASRNATVPTDSSGVATLNGFDANEIGAYTITATAPTGAMVTFSLLVQRGCTAKDIAEHRC
jgi:hypothetical protein